MHIETLLSSNNKLDKTTKKTARILVAGLTLAPHSLGGFGTVCAGATAGCMAVCNLWFSGRRISASARARAKRLTALYFEHRREFEDKLCREIAAHEAKARRLKLRPAVRLNVASDLDWTHIVEQFPRVAFYDYTKIRSRFRDYLDGKLPANWDLIYSASERSHPATLAAFLRAGGNVAQVYAVDYFPAVGRVGKLPRTQTYWRQEFPVFDADKHDIRLPSIDGRGRVGGLRMKGTANRTKELGKLSGFAMSLAN